MTLCVLCYVDAIEQGHTNFVSDGGGDTCQNLDRDARPVFFGFQIWPNPIFLGWQIF